MRLHQMQDSGNCYKVRLTLAQLGVPAELVDVDILGGESRTDAFLGTLNPNGRVPVLEIDERTALPESDAIIWYFAESTRLVPTDKLARARVLQWMFFEQYSHEPYIATVRYWVHIVRDADGFARQIEERTPGGYAALDVMDRHLDTHEFLAGDYSIADVALYAYTHVAHQGGFDLAAYANVNRWLDAVANQPGHIDMEARSW